MNRKEIDQALEGMANAARERNADSVRMLNGLQVRARSIGGRVGFAVVGESDSGRAKIAARVLAAGVAS